MLPELMILLRNYENRDHREEGYTREKRPREDALLRLPEREVRDEP